MALQKTPRADGSRYTATHASRGNRMLVFVLGLLLGITATSSTEVARADARAELAQMPVTRAKDLRLTAYWPKPDPRKKVAIDPKALKFVSDMSSQPSPNAPNNPNAHRSVSAEWNEYTGTIMRLSLDWEYTFALLPGESDEDQSRRFILTHPELFRLTEAALKQFRVRIDPMGKAKMVIYEQEFPDYVTYLPLTITFDYAAQPGRFLTIGAKYFPGEHLARATPKLTPAQAVKEMRKQLPNLWRTWDDQPIADVFDPVVIHGPNAELPNFPLPTKENPSRSEPVFHVGRVGMDFTNDLDARLVYFLFGGDLRLAWFFTPDWQTPFIQRSNGSQHIAQVEILVDAENAQVLAANVQSAEQWSVQ